MADDTAWDFDKSHHRFDVMLDVIAFPYYVANGAAS
jgi:hypothetical protein